MDCYIGTKLILAEPMTRGDYNQLRGWETPNNEDPNDQGFLVEYLDGGPANHPDYTNYISWSPDGAFDSAYLQITYFKEYGIDLTLVPRSVLDLAGLYTQLKHEHRKLNELINSKEYHSKTDQERVNIMLHKTYLELHAKAVNQRLSGETATILLNKNNSTKPA